MWVECIRKSVESFCHCVCYTKSSFIIYERKIYTHMNVCARLFLCFFSLYLHLDSIYCLVYITKYFVCTRVFFFILILTVLLLYRYFITYLSEFSTFMLEIIFTNILHAVTCSSRLSYSQWTMLHRDSM